MVPPSSVAVITARPHATALAGVVKVVQSPPESVYVRTDVPPIVSVKPPVNWLNETVAVYVVPAVNVWALVEELRVLQLLPKVAVFLTNETVEVEPANCNRAPSAGWVIHCEPAVLDAIIKVMSVDPVDEMVMGALTDASGWPTL